MFSFLFGSGSKTTSTSKTDILMKSVTDVVVRSIMSCSFNQVVTQELRVVGSGNIINGVRMVQATKLSTTCVQDSKTVANIQNNITSALTQAADSNSVSFLNAFGGAQTKAETIANIQNIVENSVTSEALTQIVLYSNSQQGIYIDGNNNILTNISQEQTTTIVSDNAQSVLSNTELATIISTAVKQSAAATESNPLSVFADMFNNLFSGLFSALLIPLCIFGGVIALVFIYIGYTSMTDDDDDEADAEVAVKAAAVKAAAHKKK
jgi:hypothetical protein